MSRPPDYSIEPGAASAALDAAFARLDRLRFAQALWHRDLDMWTHDRAVQRKIGQRLGWLDAIEFATAHREQVESFARSVSLSGFSDIILLGMGGSSLAPEVFHRVFGRTDDLPRFTMLDSTDPQAVRRVMGHPETSLFIVASKSGTTVEPNSMAAAARRRVEAAGVKGWASHFVAITDEDTDLHRRALNEGYREIFVNPSDIGGRYSALSFFGLVPAALMGVPLDALLDEARAMVDACRQTDPRTNPGVALGAMMAACALSGRDKLTLLTADRLESFGVWVEQLVAESTGKESRGIVPIVGETTDAPPGDDRLAVVLRVGGASPDTSAIDRLRTAAVPMITIDLARIEALGAEFFRWEVATATAGRLLDINPFDEPNVQQAKDATQALLQTFTTLGQLPARPPDATHEEIEFTFSQAARQHIDTKRVDGFLQMLAVHDYFAFLAYVPPGDPELAPIFEEFRNHVAVVSGRATVLGYGPRYLHSTGQLYKGGPNSGVFVIVTAPSGDDVAIPGAPYSFGVLEMAQALGDFQSLDDSGRRAMHAHLPDRKPATARKLMELLGRGLRRPG